MLRAKFFFILKILVKLVSFYTFGFNLKTSVKVCLIEETLYAINLGEGVHISEEKIQRFIQLLNIITSKSIQIILHLSYNFLKHTVDFILQAEKLCINNFLYMTQDS